MTQRNKWLALLCFFSISSSATPLTVSTWNIEWLTTKTSNQLSIPQRTQEDKSKLSEYFNKLNSDVVAFQEVDSIEALSRISGNEYDLFLSERADPVNKQHQFSHINQYTGFAVRKGTSFTNYADFPLEKNSKLRFASYISVEIDGNEVHLLSIHLKAGCSGAYRGNKNCQRLKAQGKRLNQWIRAREESNDAYIILGDFNHNLGYSNDWMWDILTDNTSATLATKNTQAKCKIRSNRHKGKTHQFRSVIDHIVVSDSLSFQPAEQNLFKTQDVLDFKLSDHCPVSSVVQLVTPSR
ncbi:endonuclease/exonuclease/phosphatase family protein [Vibrio sp. 99-70-13A1]|uniref:endonuclease/exonuclease/phosphatase family protein n=1 Tax=Vibrio sp. 99-70-13A1 TaxID=2607601 RepID=UPI001493688F|nr:endonuclease/exonuclease/phosphatase family protein [Vibrio sp. 99-70-13A1]NOH96946.1 metal-dependent hydrolase [Vibrio sp. 99-70-13A1]